jgi:hypothetical protein
MMTMHRIFCLFCAALLFVSCATTGVRDAGAFHGGFDGFPADALAYIRIDVKSTRKLMDGVLARNGLNTEAVKKFLDKTDTVAAAVFPLDAERRFLLAADGKNYPAAASSFSFAFSPAWKKIASATGRRYWRNEAKRLSLVLSSGNAYISDADPFFTGPRAVPPDSFAPFAALADASVWVWDTSFIDTALAVANVPITIPSTGLFIALFRQTDGWRLALRLEMPSAAQAKGLAAVLTMLRTSLRNGAVKLDPEVATFANLLLSEPPQADGSAIVFQNPHLGDGELYGLTELLPLNFK